MHLTDKLKVIQITVRQPMPALNLEAIEGDLLMFPPSHDRQLLLWSIAYQKELKRRST